MDVVALLPHIKAILDSEANWIEFEVKVPDEQKAMDSRLNDQLKEIGWRFENGGFVPVDAHGEIFPLGWPYSLKIVFSCVIDSSFGSLRMER